MIGQNWSELKRIEEKRWKQEEREREERKGEIVLLRLQYYLRSESHKTAAQTLNMINESIWLS